MAGFGVFKYRASKVARVIDVAGDPDARPIPLTSANFVPTNACPPVIGRLLGALNDVPPNAWLFV